MNGRILEAQPAPAISPGNVVILDNVGFHKSERAEQFLNTQAVLLLFPPPNSPDLNPIEMTFSKLKALLRKRAARSFDSIASFFQIECNAGRKSTYIAV